MPNAAEPKPSGDLSHTNTTTLNPKAVIALVIVVVAVIFIFSNTSDVTVNWLFFEFKAPGWMLYLLLFAGGGLVGFFLGRNRYKRKAA